MRYYWFRSLNLNIKEIQPFLPSNINDVSDIQLSLHSITGLF